MNPGGNITISPTVYLRYVLLGLLELVVVMLLLVLAQRWLGMPAWLFWGLTAGWIVKDVALFPFVWRAYDQDAPSLAGDMRGGCGTVKKKLDPAGYVQVRGELWRALREGDGPPIEAGRRVRIHRREGLTLYVTPDDSGQARN